MSNENNLFDHPFCVLVFEEETYYGALVSNVFCNKSIVFAILFIEDLQLDSVSSAKIFNLVFDILTSQKGPCKHDSCDVEADVHEQENDSDNKVAKTSHRMTQTIRIATHSAQTDKHKNKGEKGTGDDDHTDDCSCLNLIVTYF